MSLREPLDAVESRIFGALVEKSFTTPESYPLSLNSLVAACNQKSNRHPVAGYDERTVIEALTRLRLHRLVNEVHSSGARVTKYDHNGQSTIEVDDAELAVLAELLLRGPQQPGELRGRASRMVEIPSLEVLDALLNRLAGRNLVERLPPEPGSRAARWRQLLAPRLHGGTPPGSPPRPAPAVTEAPAPRSATSPPAPAPGADADLARRLAALEARVAALEERLDPH